MKLITIGLFALLSLTAFAQDSVTVVGSKIGRGDAIYNVIYGFESKADSDNGYNHIAVIIIECRKQSAEYRSKKPSYFTIQKDGAEKIEEISHSECTDLYKLVDDATIYNPSRIQL